MTKEKLYDNHGRIINYLRLAVTDRCNLRCYYCMPEEGIKYVPKEELLSYEEMLQMIEVLTQMGIDKIRITGGEPFVRKGMMGFLSTLSENPAIQQLNITTNGTLTSPIIPDLKKIGISSVNLSLDTLDRDRFFKITRRDELPKVMESLEQLLKHGIKTKINAVVMKDQNEEDIIPMCELAKNDPIGVRFIEEMPFNGEGAKYEGLYWTHPKILSHIKSVYPDIKKIPDPPNSTSYNYQIPGFKGTIGIIAAFSRSFCGTCNRIRITPKGMLKTCLYDTGVFDIKTLMRKGASQEQLRTAFLQALGNRAIDGFEAEKNRKGGRDVSESMSTIGG